MASLEELLRRPHVHYDVLRAHGAGSDALSAADCTCAEIDIKYSGFIRRQEQQVAKLHKRLHRPVPQDMDFMAIETLSLEGREQLQKFRPATVGQATRLGGVDPADISALLVHLEVARRKATAAARGAEGGHAEGGAQTQEGGATGEALASAL